MPGFKELAEVIRRAGIYGPRDYLRIVQEQIRYWKIESLQGLNELGRMAQEKIMGIPARLKRIAEHMETRSTGQDLQLRGRVQPRIRDGMSRPGRSVACSRSSWAAGGCAGEQAGAQRPTARRPATGSQARCRGAGAGGLRPGGPRGGLPRLPPGTARRLPPTDGSRQPDPDHRRASGERGARAGRHGRLPPQPKAARSSPAGATARSSRKPPSTAAATRSCAPPARAPSARSRSAPSRALTSSLHDRRARQPWRAIVVVAALATPSVVALTHWAVRRRTIDPFGAWPRFVRRISDPVLLPLERRVVRLGGSPQDAPLWLLGVVIVGGLVLLSLTRWLLGTASGWRPWPARDRGCWVQAGS